ncbi:hypothetical protein ACLESD_30560, partial [Pyxidicoccus sp. 3LFB2]
GASPGGAGGVAPRPEAAGSPSPAAGTGTSEMETASATGPAQGADSAAVTQSPATDAGTSERGLDPRPPGQYASATFPVSSIWLDAKRDVIQVPRAVRGFPGLVASRLHHLSEISNEPLPPEPGWVVEPSSSAPAQIFYLLTGKGVPADTAVGEVTRKSTSFKGATAVSFFSLGTPSQEHPPERMLQIFSSQIGSEKQFVFRPELMQASLDQAFFLNGLDRTAIYSLMLKPVGAGAFTRGKARGPVRQVTCVQWSPLKPAGSRTGGWPVSFAVTEGQRVDVTGMTSLRCGFIDDDPSDNQGKVELQLRSIGTSDGEGSADRKAEELARSASRALQNKEYTQALDPARRCLELNPTHASCLLHLASALARLGNIEPASKNYRLFVQHHPDDPRADFVRKLLQDYDAQGPQPRR